MTSPPDGLTGPRFVHQAATNAGLLEGVQADARAQRAAHRGAGRLAPENTLASLRLGYSYGYRMAEIDVKLSADGVAFLLHDATLDRTTNGKGRADALGWGELSRLDAGSWHSAPHAGEALLEVK